MAALPAHWVNGQFNGNIDPTDRGLAYGDGLFETMRFYQTDVLHLSQHLARLQRGCQQLDIELDSNLLNTDLDQARAFLRAQNIANACLKLLVTRGNNSADGIPSGYGHKTGTPSIILRASHTFSLTTPRPPARIGICKTTFSQHPMLAGLKHCNRLEQVLAAQEVSTGGWDNGLMCNVQGNVISAVNANFFIYTQNQLLTPQLDACGVVGTMRQQLLKKLAPALNLSVTEASLNLNDVASADELILTNAMIGIQSAHMERQSIEAGANTEPGEIATKLWLELRRSLETVN